MLLLNKSSVEICVCSLLSHRVANTTFKAKLEKSISLHNDTAKDKQNGKPMSYICLSQLKQKVWSL